MLEEIRDETERFVLDCLPGIAARPEDRRKTVLAQFHGAGASLGSAALAKPLETLIAELPDATEEQGKAAVQALATISRRKQALTKELLDLAKQAIAISAGSRHRGIARALNHLLRGNSHLGKLLGLRKHKGEWFDKMELKRLKKGLVWDTKLGWMKKKPSKRAGESYFDMQAKTWTTLAAANEAHSTLDNPWRVETNDYILEGNAPLREIVALREKLRRNHVWVVATFSPVLSKLRHKGRTPPLLLVARPEHTPFRIFFARTKAEYFKVRKREPNDSVGVYSGAQRRCIFPLEGFDDSDALHEGTHQIITEQFELINSDARNTRGLPQWFEEGVADYASTTDLVLYTEDGIDDMKAGKHEAVRSTLGTVMTLAVNKRWQAESTGDTYAWTYMLIRFLFEYNHGEYEGDVMDFIVDSQSQRVTMLDYIGLTLPEFYEKFRAWWLEPAQQPR